ncbi:MAG: hypothetical protein ACLGQW_08325 [Acidobacteriota bacterium]
MSSLLDFTADLTTVHLLAPSWACDFSPRPSLTLKIIFSMDYLRLASRRADTARSRRGLARASSRKSISSWIWPPFDAPATEGILRHPGKRSRESEQLARHRNGDASIMNTTTRRKK